MKAFLYLAVALLAPRVAIAQLIGVYADSAGNSCNLAVPFPGPPVDVYVLFTPGGGVDGTQSASLVVDGLPSGWTVEEFPNPLALNSTGSIFQYAQIFFESCQAGGPIVLWRVRLTPTSAVSDGELQVRGIQPHSEPPCPGISSCPDSRYPLIAGGGALLNSGMACDPRALGGCTITDVPFPPTQAWSLVKALYRP